VSAGSLREQGVLFAEYIVTASERSNRFSRLGPGRAVEEK
jgi:hypothetical protein